MPSEHDRLGRTRESLRDFVNDASHPLHDEAFRSECKEHLDTEGSLVLRHFLTAAAVDAIRREGADNSHRAYYTTSTHNIYLSPPNPSFPATHARNREVVSTKGCITTDQIPRNSPLRRLYDAPQFRDFLCAVLGENALYEYADPLSSINLHYAGAGQELGWHFDNSSFAITLMIRSAERGGVFEFVKNVRDADAGQMNYAVAARVLDGDEPAQTLSFEAGDLVLFRGRNTMHRVTPVEGERTRILAVLAYNSAPGIALSESARMTFYGRLS